MKVTGLELCPVHEQDPVVLCGVGSGADYMSLDITKTIKIIIIIICI